MKGFTVIYRNFGHWDIVVPDMGRAFRIRGTPGKFCVLDERAAPYSQTDFKTVSGCMLFISEQLMHENLVADSDSSGNNKPLP